jgi:O-antigen ligase
LRNGGFSDRLAHWFPVAQGYFLQWHIDNLYLELLIERGPAALLAFVAAIGWTLRRLMTPPGRDAMLAPFLAASLCGVLLVGLVSSVFDAARPQFLMWFLFGFAMLLCGTTSNAASPSTSTRCR